MKSSHPAKLVALSLAAAVLACGPQEETSKPAPSLASLSSGGVNATMTVDSWGAGYCANITLANAGTSAVTSWTLGVALNGTTLGNLWGGTSTASGGQLTVRPVDYNANIAPGASVSLGFCGSGTGQPALATLEVVGGGGGPGNPTLTVSKNGQGAGTVTSSPAGIDCGTTCSAGYPAGTRVTLTAVAANGATFAGWSGTCAGFAAGVLTLDASCAVTAIFNPIGGTGTTVSVNAGGAAAGSFVADASFSGGSTYSTTRTIDTAQVAGTVPPQAVFQTERYGEFTYTIGSRTPGSAQTVTLYFAETYWTAAGQRTFNVAINGATALTAFDIFAAAGGANRAVARTFETTASASGQVVIAFTRGGGPDNPKVCGITVSGGGGGPDVQTLSVTKAGTGSGTVTSGGTPSGGGINCGSLCSASYVTGTTVTLTATVASGSTFAGWSGACSGTATTCTVSMTAARSVTATFNSLVTTYALTVAKAGTGSGTVTSNPSGINCGSTCTASYQSGTSVTLSATPATGATFGGWSGACTGTGSCIVSMTAARSVTASFTGSGSCTIGATRGSEVAVIGDSFIAMSHGITREIERLARAAGSLGASDRYVDNSVSGTTLANNQIPGQYTRAVQSSGRIRYVLMDGGGNDCLINNNANAAYSAAQSLFQTMAQNNTEKVVYFFYPDPVGGNYASLKTCLDGLRPRMKALCDGLTAPKCYWLDLRPTWNGHPEYTSDGIHPTDQGSVVTGQAVWQAMKTNCVAQ